MKPKGMAAAVAACVCSIASAEMVSITASQDATLYESFDGSLANGAGRYFFVGKNNQNRARRGLLRFDLSGVVPSGMEITGARLIINLSQGTPGESAVSVHRALNSWTAGPSNPDDPEGSGTAALAGDTTWLHSSLAADGGGTYWQNAGGDFAVDASASTLTSAVGLYTLSSAQLLADVLAFASDGSTNFGWFLIGDESTFGTARRFDSTEGAELGGFAPTLEIELTAVPEPGAMALFGAALLVARRSRR